MFSQWFNLDSLKDVPELISDTYLRLFLAQLETEGKDYISTTCDSVIVSNYLFLNE